MRLDPDDVGVIVGADPQGQLVAQVAVDSSDRRDAGALVADLMVGIALDLAPEPRVIGHDEPEVPDLRPVHVRPVDLVEDAAPDREPDAARVVGRPDGVLVAARPRRCDARRARRERRCGLIHTSTSAFAPGALPPVAVDRTPSGPTRPSCMFVSWWGATARSGRSSIFLADPVPAAAACSLRAWVASFAKRRRRPSARARTAIPGAVPLGGVDAGDRRWAGGLRGRGRAGSWCAGGRPAATPRTSTIRRSCCPRRRRG